MRYQFTTERRAEYINPMLYEGLVLTAGSSSIPGFYGAMRQAAAATRKCLLRRRRRLGARPDEFSVAESKVTHSSSARYFTFGQLAAGAPRSKFPRNLNCALETSFI